jgi:hypothetical protein
MMDVAAEGAIETTEEIGMTVAVDRGLPSTIMMF